MHVFEFIGLFDVQEEAHDFSVESALVVLDLAEQANSAILVKFNICVRRWRAQIFIHAQFKHFFVLAALIGLSIFFKNYYLI